MATVFKQVKNNAKSLVLNDALNNTTTPLSFDVSPGDGAKFSDSVAPEDFWVTAWDESAYPDPGDDPKMRIGLCTARTTDTLTVTWGQFDTPVLAISGRPRIAMLIVDQHFEDIHTALNAVETAMPVDANLVHTTGAEAIAGVKTFSSSPIVPTPTTSTQAVNKSYADALTFGSGGTESIYYVSADGNDSNNGLSWGSPFATVQAAFDAINGGSTPTNNPGTVYVGDGTFTLPASSITITRLQSLVGMGAARTILEVAVNGPGLTYTGVYPEVTPYSTTNYPNTGLKGFTIQPSGAAGTDTAGIKVVDIVFPQIIDVFATRFIGVRGVGIWVFNKEVPDGASPGGFVERLQLKQVATDNNTYGILLDRLIAGQPNGINDYRTDQAGYGGYGNTSTNADNSVMYHTWEGVSVNARAVASGANAQIGIQIQKGVQFYHGSIGVQFNITGVNGSNTVAPTAINIQNASAANSTKVVIRGESSGTGATSIAIDDTSTFDAFGMVDFLYSANFGALITGTGHAGTFKFSGGANGYGLTPNTTQATKPIQSVIEKTTLANASSTAPPNGPALRIGTSAIDSTHPAFDFLRITNQRFGLNSYDGTTTLTYLQIFQDATRPMLQATQGIKIQTGAEIYSGSGAPNIANSAAGSFYLRNDAAGNYPQQIYAASATNTWFPLGVYNPTTGIVDVNNKLIIGFTPVGTSAVNYLNIQNATTGNSVAIGAAGTDASIDILFASKGPNGTFVFKPSIGNDNSAAVQFRRADNASVLLGMDSANARIGINTPIPSYALEIAGTTKSKLLIGHNAAPPVATLGAGLNGGGTGSPSVSITGNNIAGKITAQAGTGGNTANATVASIVFGTPATTVAAGSNGVTLPVTVINVAATSGFPGFGTFTLNSETITYTGITATTFTGCSGGTSTLATSDVITMPATAFPAAPYITLTPGNGTAAALGSASQVYVDESSVTTTGFNLKVGGTAIADSAALVWFYHVIG